MLGGKRASGTAEITGLPNVNDVWVAVEPTGKQCLWSRQNKFKVICCKDAFSVKSTCKFSFCPQCAIDVQDKLGQGQGGETGERANSRSSKRTKPVKGAAGAVAPTGNTKKKGGEVVCGKHTLKDLLTLDHEQTSKTYLKCNRENVTGAENIAVHCVKCGIRF